MGDRVGGMCGHPGGWPGELKSSSYKMYGIHTHGDGYLHRAYVGLWNHNPLPNNPHVFTRAQEAGQSGQPPTLFWNGHNWRTSTDPLSADPAGGRFDSGNWYFCVPGGASNQYKGKYESGGACLQLSQDDHGFWMFSPDCSPIILFV
jgi:hypothetical protein